MLRVVIPMAGSGQRFKDAGYTDPKPLIDVCGKPMIQRVMESLTPSGGAEFTLLPATTEGTSEYKFPPCRMVGVGQTEGAVDTLLRVQLVTEDPVLVANCDQWIKPGIIDEFLAAYVVPSDAALMTFNSTNPHHSYVRRNGRFVTAIAEKQVISDDAVLGVYWFRTGALLEEYARKAMATGERLNGEVYVSSIIAAMVADGLTVTAFEVDVHDKAMLGTPEELRIFEAKVADGRVVL